MQPESDDAVVFTCVPAGIDDDKPDVYIPGFTHEMSDVIFRAHEQTKTCKTTTTESKATDVRVEYELLPEMAAAEEAAEEELRNELYGGFGEPYIPPIVYGSIVAIASSGVTALALKLLKLWVDARKGRKLKIKVGDIEVEATQMKEADVLRIFELLEEKADRKKIREALIEAGKDGGRPEAR